MFPLALLARHGPRLPGGARLGRSPYALALPTSCSGAARELSTSTALHRPRANDPASTQGAPPIRPPTAADDGGKILLPASTVAPIATGTTTAKVSKLAISSLPTTTDATSTQVSETVHGRLRIYDVPLPATTSTDGTTPSRLQWAWRTSDGEKDHGASQLIDPRRMLPFLRSTFLPVGYPHSVHPSYLRFHAWKFAETAVGSCIYVLSHQALLSALNVGATQSAGVQAAMAAGSAAAVQLILKDGLGEIGKLVLIQKFSSQFDSRLKTWKLAGETASVAGVLFSMLTVVAPSSAWFLPLASIGGALKSFYITLWSTVHASFARQWAARANLADIMAKDEAQLSVASMLGAGTGVALIALIRHDPPFLFGCYALLAPLQMYCSVRMLQSAHFTILTDVKVALLARHWLDQQQKPTAAASPKHALASPISSEQVLAQLPEHGFMGEFVRPSAHVPGIKIAQPIASVFDDAPAVLAHSLALMPRERYVLRWTPSTPLAGGASEASAGGAGSVGIALRADAKARDIAQSVFHAVVLHQARGDGEAAYAKVQQVFPKFYAELMSSPHWDSKRVYFDDRGVRYSLPSKGSAAASGAQAGDAGGVKEEEGSEN